MPRQSMKAIVTTGNGGYDRLEYSDVPVPAIGPGEVLLRVLAAGVNNTDINTRLGWYASAVRDSTNAMSDAAGATEAAPVDGGWNARTPFPLIQGTDCCGRVVQVADDVDSPLLERRVLVRSCMREHGFDSLDSAWLGVDVDGAFAQFVKVPAGEVFPVECDWSDAELGTLPCACGTAENMLERIGVRADDTLLVTGASGGVGSACVQLAKRRGARVVAVAGADKHARVAQLGADLLLARDADPVAELGEQSVDVVVDNVAGDGFAAMLKVLRRGGRLVSAGAIAGPMVGLDLRDMYLKDITLMGTTAWDEAVFPNLVRYVEQGGIRPVLAKTFPLSAIAAAQREFLAKRHVGKLVLLPWSG